MWGLLKMGGCLNGEGFRAAVAGTINNPISAACGVRGNRMSEGAVCSPFSGRTLPGRDDAGGSTR